MMKRMRLYISLIIIMTSFAAAYCGNPRSIRHHCSNDTTEISELLRRGFESGITNPNKLISQYARWLLDKPYVAHTLEGDEEMLTINIDELDCPTLVETLYALARTTHNKR